MTDSSALEYAITKSKNANKNHYLDALWLTMPSGGVWRTDGEESDLSYRSRMAASFIETCTGNPFRYGGLRGLGCAEEDVEAARSALLRLGESNGELLFVPTASFHIDRSCELLRVHVGACCVSMRMFFSAVDGYHRQPYEFRTDPIDLVRMTPRVLAGRTFSGHLSLTVETSSPLAGRPLRENEMPLIILEVL